MLRVFEMGISVDAPAGAKTIPFRLPAPDTGWVHGPDELAGKSGTAFPQLVVLGAAALTACGGIPAGAPSSAGRAALGSASVLAGAAVAHFVLLDGGFLKRPDRLVHGREWTKRRNIHIPVRQDHGDSAGGDEHGRCARPPAATDKNVQAHEDRHGGLHVEQVPLPGAGRECHLVARGQLQVHNSIDGQGCGSRQSAAEAKCP